MVVTACILTKCAKHCVTEQTCLAALCMQGAALQWLQAIQVDEALCQSSVAHTVLVSLPKPSSGLRATSATAASCLKAHLHLGCSVHLDPHAVPAAALCSCNLLFPRIHRRLWCRSAHSL